MKLNTEKCLQWAKERGLLGEKPDTSKQFQKLASECMEFLDEINKGNLEKAYLEFGDVLVTMIIYCEQRGLSFYAVANQEDNTPSDGLILLMQIGACARNEQNFGSPLINKNRVEWDLYVLLRSVCFLASQFDPQKALDLAVEKISNRKTTIVNGTAVKEGDFIHKGFGECVGGWNKDGNYVTEEHKIDKTKSHAQKMIEADNNALQYDWGNARKQLDELGRTLTYEDLDKTKYNNLCNRMYANYERTVELHEEIMVSLYEAWNKAKHKAEEQKNLYLKTNGLD